MFNLEEILANERTREKFHSDFSHLELEIQKLAEMLLAISHTLTEKGLQGEYVVYGGYAILLQLVKHIGYDVIRAWRGSHDLDLVANNEVIGNIKTLIPIVSDRKSETVQGKRTLRVQLADYPQTFKIDIRQKEAFSSQPEQVYEGQTETVDFYGIPVVVPTVYQQLRNKLGVTRKLERDTIDVFNLLGILEISKQKESQLASELSRPQRKRLYDLIKGEKFLYVKNIPPVYLTSGQSPQCWYRQWYIFEHAQNVGGGERSEHATSI